MSREIRVDGRQLYPGPIRTAIITATYNGKTDTVSITQDAYLATLVTHATTVWDETTIGNVAITFTPQGGWTRHQTITFTVTYTTITGTPNQTASVSLGSGESSTVLNVTGCGSIDSLSVSPVSDAVYNYTVLLTGTPEAIFWSASSGGPGDTITLKASRPWSISCINGATVSNSSGGGAGALIIEITLGNTTHSQGTATVTWHTGATTNISITGHPATNLEVVYNGISTQANGDPVVVTSGDSITITSLQAWTSTLVTGTGSISPSSGGSGTTQSTVIGNGGAGSYKAVFTIQANIDVIAILVV